VRCCGYLPAARPEVFNHETEVHFADHLLAS
jgi:hypothetical protein